MPADADTGADAPMDRLGADADGPSEWMGENLAVSRNAIEDELGTRLDNVFPEDGELGRRVRAHRRCHGRAFGMGERRLRRPRGRRL